ncbi:MAG: HAD hydrolase family protein [Clostridia bacterium]|nr:HAD hydrolase family protein [Clostridia bacterium]
MDFSKYLIATDLDGTFFADGSQLVPRNLEAVRRFCEGGGMFTLATGRVQLNIFRRIPQPEALLSAPAVMCNGAYLYDFSTRTALFEEFIPEQDARELLAFAKANFPDVAFRVAAPNALRIEDPSDPFLARDLLSYPPESVYVGPVDALPMDDWYKIVFRADGARNAQVRAMLSAHFGDRLSVIPSDPRILEVQLPTTTKATGIEKLRRLIGDSTRTVITCGDFENDIPMHRVADVSVCPANACDAVKRICDYVLCDHNEGLIADVIARIERGELTAKKKRGITV